MTEVTHTPGPWFVASNGLNKVATITNTTAIYADQMPTEFSISADARLIAAAPELLAALQWVNRAAAEDSPQMWGAVSDAIAKATGAA